MTSPALLDGSLVLNDIVSISYIRIAIFVLALGAGYLFCAWLVAGKVSSAIRAIREDEARVR